jgi:hypothetical protein
LELQGEYKVLRMIEPENYFLGGVLDGESLGVVWTESVTILQSAIRLVRLVYSKRPPLI